MRHLHESGSDLERVLKALGRLWLAGVDVDWASFHGGERRRRVALPTYPFERQRYWAEPLATRKAPARSAPRKTTDIADWFYVPSWHRSAFPSPAARNGEARWLVFVDDSRWGAEVLRRLERSARAVAVRTGGSFVEVGDRAYAVDPRRPEDYGALLRKLRARDHVPNRVAHLWGVTSDAASGSAGLDELQDRGFYSLLFLAQAMAQELPGQPLDIALVTSGVQDVTAGEALCPGKAMALGPCKVIPQEYPAITCRSIDIDTPDSGTSAEREVERLVAEIEGSSAEPVVAHRRNRRWVQRFQPLRVEARTGRPTRLREGGVYLITGGLGGVGLEIATSLAKAARAKLVLTTRSLFPPREEWLEWRRTHDEAEATTRRIHRIRELEDLGAEVLIVRADVAREPEMRAVVARTIERFGVLHGVVHAAGAEKRGRSIAEADRAHCERQFLPKVEGLTVLAKVLEGQPIDFCIVYSSLASVLGVIGFASYTAAHLFMDAFVGQQNRADGGVPWICVNSDNWQTRQFAGPVLLGLSDFMMAPDEGAEVFQRILGLDGETQVVVSTGDLQARVDRWVTRLLPGEDQAPVEAVARHVRPDLATPYAAPRNEAERTVAGIWQTLLGIERVGIHDNFFALGGDSVLSIQVAARSAEQGIPLSSHEVLEHQTIAELARVSGVRRVTPLGQGVAGRVPLTPIQHWFFAQGLVEPEHFNQAMLLEVVQPVELSLLEQAWQRLVERHDALRLRYVEDEKGWHGVYGDSDASAAITRIDLAERAEAEQRAAVEAAAAGIQSRLDLSQGPLVRVVYFDLGSSRTARLFLIIHHLLVDVVSWRILSEDLQTALRQLGAAQAIQLPSPSTPFGRWAQELEQHAKSGAVDAEAAYWLSLPWDRVVPLPVDKPGGVNTAGSIGTVSLSFEVEETRRLMQELPERYQVQVNEVLLTAVAMALRSWTGAGVLLIDVEGHGREAVVAGADLSRTVGWFTTLFPLLVDLEGPGEPLVLLKRVKERLRAVPNHGIGYGLLRHVRKDEATENALRALPLPEVSFLYLGRFDPAMAGSALFKPAAESSGPTRSPRGRRQHLLEVAAHVSEGRLWARWIYSGELHHRSTIETLAEAFADALRTLLRPTESTGLDTRIAADFPGTRLDKNELQEFLSSLGQPGGTPSR
jgi:non-ribosomal peptide synthase protein (TIGR01720 family)